MKVPKNNTLIPPVILFFVLVLSGMHAAAQTCTYWGPTTHLIPRGCHFQYPCTDPLPIAASQSVPVFRVASFVALFTRNVIYHLTNPACVADWNKLGRIFSTQCANQDHPWGGVVGKQYYIALGWRYFNDRLELGFYSHIDHRDDSPCDENVKGREFFSLEHFTTPDKLQVGRYVSVELVFSSRGFFVRADSIGGAIRRDFSHLERNPLRNVGPSTKVKRNAYFGGNCKAPKDILIPTFLWTIDCSPTWWSATSRKVFARSEWYSCDTVVYWAREKILLNKQLEDPSQANLLGGVGFVTFHSGSNVTFVSKEVEVLPDGNGVLAEQGAEVTHIPSAGPPSSYTVSEKPTLGYIVKAAPTRVCQGECLGVKVCPLRAGFITFHVYNLAGQLVAQGSRPVSSTGWLCLWDTRGFPAGIYTLEVFVDGIKDAVFNVLVGSCSPYSSLPPAAQSQPPKRDFNEVGDLQERTPLESTTNNTMSQEPLTTFIWCHYEEGRLTVASSLDAIIEVKITDMSGRQIARLGGNGTSQIQESLHLAGGMYIINVVTESTAQVLKLTVQE